MSEPLSTPQYGKEPQTDRNHGNTAKEHTVDNQYRTALQSGPPRNMDHL